MLYKLKKEKVNKVISFIASCCGRINLSAFQKFNNSSHTKSKVTVHMYIHMYFLLISLHCQRLNLLMIQKLDKLSRKEKITVHIYVFICWYTSKFANGYFNNMKSFTTNTNHLWFAIPTNLIFNWLIYQ